MKKIRPFYTSKDIAALLGVSVSTVYDYNKFNYRGFPKGFKIGDFWRWKPDDIDAWIDTQRGVVAEQNIEHHDDEDELNIVPISSKKLARLIARAFDMYKLLNRIVDPDDVCPNKEIRELLDFINND